MHTYIILIIYTYAIQTRPLIHSFTQHTRKHKRSLTQIHTHTPNTSTDDRVRNAALDSITNDPGLQQLLPYFVQFVTDKVANNGKTLPVLMSVMRLVKAMLENPNLFVEPYVCRRRFYLFVLFCFAISGRWLEL